MPVVSKVLEDVGDDRCLAGQSEGLQQHAQRLVYPRVIKVE